MAQQNYISGSLLQAIISVQTVLAKSASSGHSRWPPNQRIFKVIFYHSQAVALQAMVSNPLFRNLRCFDLSAPKSHIFAIANFFRAEFPHSENSHEILILHSRNLSRKFLATNFGLFRATFPEERGQAKISPNIFHCKFPAWLHEENSRRSSANPVLTRFLLQAGNRCDFRHTLKQRNVAI